MIWVVVGVAGAAVIGIVTWLWASDEAGPDDGSSYWDQES